jgi:enamine deaminase RidA (YjgF/YER057c/UK114 family)
MSELPAPKGYAHVVEATGSRLLFISGQLPLDPDRSLVSDDFGLQVRQAFANLGIALAQAGAAWGDVVKLGIFVTELERLEELRAIRDEFVDVASPPASTLVQVIGLAVPGAKVEIEAYASPRLP